VSTILAVRCLVVCLCGCAGLCCWSVAADADGVASPLSGSLVTPGSPVEGEQTLAEREASLSSPEAVAEREASRMKFEGLSASQAASVAGEAFPAVVDEPAGGPPKLPAGQSVSGYDADNAAQLDLPNGEHGVLESTEPMAIETSPGQRTPIDLSLRGGEGGFLEPKTPAVPVRIPEQLGAGVQLPDVGVSLTPVDAQGAVLSGSEAVVDGASALSRK
jgi:hypothetical protein